MDKKLLTLMFLLVGLQIFAQTPIYHFTFDNTLQDVSNSHVFALNPGMPILMESSLHSSLIIKHNLE
jgi:hypothetical protein